MHCLAVAHYHDEHDQGDGNTNFPREREPSSTSQRQGNKDLVGSVCHARERVGGEHGQRDPLRKESLAQRTALEFAPDEHPFDGLENLHGGPLYLRTTSSARRHHHPIRQPHHRQVDKRPQTRQLDQNAAQ